MCTCIELLTRDHCFGRNLDSRIKIYHMKMGTPGPCTKYVKVERILGK